MAHLELLVNKLIAISVAVITLSGCGHVTDNQVRINATDARLKHTQGSLYYSGNPLTGYTFELFDNGDTAKITPYINGKQSGTMRWWHQNHQLAQERFFVDGRKEGIHKGWWPDGKIQFEYHFTDDEYEGEVKEWYNTGKLCRMFHYDKGHEQGNQQMWWDDGTIRANYTIVNGEKFGLFGQKICVNDLAKR